MDASYFITRCDAIYSLMLLAAVEIIRWWLQKEKAKVDFLVTNHILAHAHVWLVSCSPSHADDKKDTCSQGR